MELMAKAAGAAVVGSLCALALRRYVPELALVLGIVTAGTVLIAVLSRLDGQVCQDAGEGSAALCCELAGTFAALCAVLPLLRQVLSLIGEMAQ